jgi:hypothetical protein
MSRGGFFFAYVCICSAVQCSGSFPGGIRMDIRQMIHDMYSIGSSTVQDRRTTGKEKPGYIHISYMQRFNILVGRMDIRMLNGRLYSKRKKKKKKNPVMLGM